MMYEIGRKQHFLYNLLGSESDSIGIGHSSSIPISRRPLHNFVSSCFPLLPLPVVTLIFTKLNIK